MSRDRPYRRAMDRELITDELRRFSGTQFDPEIAKEFLVLVESGACDVDPEIVADALANAHDSTASNTTNWETGR